MDDIGRGFAQFLTGIIIIAGIFLMVRPGTQGPTLVTNVGSALTNLVTAGTGGGTWSSS